MHSEIGNITRYYPFKHSAYRQYFSYDDLADSIRKLRPVSYTHLTLPTKA